ncbi:hypothetical protein OTK49_02240 [Vibrio coralliirubri]|uniref:hypothetical protein n=1 Tax=Vibrio coralliirubri TaxID=1516159 RepID=UPI00228379F9|nr:hypothetical protein [Vibrio coralliirubri]MCY9861335.1 hypothetical protein [Vibrio coralliirubri]
MNKEFSIALMKNANGSLNYQMRSTEIFAGFSVVLKGRHSIVDATVFVRQEYYDALIGAGILYFAPSNDVLDSQSFNVDTHLVDRNNTTYEPHCYYCADMDTTTVNVIARYFVIAESRFSPDYMYQCLSSDFTRLIGKQACLAVSEINFACEWFKEGDK